MGRRASLTPDGRRSILVIRLSAIGDCVMTSAAVTALRRACPDDYIAWVVEPKSAPVVVGNRYVDDVLLWERDTHGYFSPGAVLSLKQRLAPLGVDIALDFQGLARCALIAATSGASKRVAFADAREGATIAANYLVSTARASESVIQRNLRFLEAIGIKSPVGECHVPVSAEGRAEFGSLMDRLGHDGGPLLGLHLKGSWAHKFWPTDRWATVAEMAVERWGLRPMILGGPADRHDAAALVEACRAPLLDTVGELSLAGSVAAIEQCGAVIGPDTGTIHISGALGVPTVCLFGPTRPELVTPPGEHVRSLIHRMPCHPCVRRPICRHYDCMLGLETEWVIDALDDLMTRYPPQSRRARKDP